MPRLQVASFAHVADASIDFGDLTVLVGAQGTGKSLLFQWLKTAIDGKQILTALREAGQDVSQPDALVDLIFGVGMGSAWTSSTEVKFNGKSIRPRNIGKLGNGRERVFFRPRPPRHAHKRRVGRAHGPRARESSPLCCSGFTTCSPRANG